ncbi:MAG TPA: CsbD family protein [Ornithinibacter sp.]|nr:CsbD family protein [Ornithinibacter sp.]
MGIGDKMDNTKDDLMGKGKEATGKVTDNERLEAEGRAQQSEADIKQAGEKVKDAFKN